MSRPVIFLDFDGPLVSYRSHVADPDSSLMFRAPDPVGGRLIRLAVERANAWIVVSSSWRRKGHGHCVDLLKRAQVVDGPRALHADWHTPTDLPQSERGAEVRAWIERHPATEAWVAIDDDPFEVDAPGVGVWCSTWDGFLWRDYQALCAALDVET